VDWVFITGVPLWRRLDEYMTLEETFCNRLFKQEVVTVPISHIFFLVIFFEEAFIRNPIIVQSIKYVIIIIIIIRIIVLLFSLVLQPSAGYGLLVHEVS
jgi:hypothetical protein